MPLCCYKVVGWLQHWARCLHICFQATLSFNNNHNEDEPWETMDQWQMGDHHAALQAMLKPQEVICGQLAEGPIDQ